MVLAQNWYLADAAKPFEEAIRPGDQVKLRFMNTGETLSPVDASTGKTLPWQFGGESMWVVVTGNKKPVSDYTGILLSHPLAIRASCKDKVSFSPRHVIEIRKLTGLASIFYRTLAAVDDFFS